MNINIATIVVTYNRKELLIENLNALLNQSFSIQKIYVVDNNSSDGTIESLDKFGFSRNNRIEIIALNENTGGAGGFYYGLEKAIQEGYDWYWLMDDDCLPDYKCLEALLNSEKGKYISPLVLSREDRVTSVWWSNMKIGTGLQEVSSIPFNGVLINRSVIMEQGLPMKELFLFCDDIEYAFRARINKNILYVNTNAILFHPINRSSVLSAFYNKIKIPVFNVKIKQYCFLRNNIYILNKYGKKLDYKFGKEIIKQIYYALFINSEVLKIVFYGIYHGLTNNFSETKKFM